MPPQVYPAWAYAYGHGADFYYVGCFHMILEGTRPWLVHQSWLTFFEAFEEEIEV